VRADISAMSEVFIGKVEIPAKGLDGEGLQLIFGRKQKKNDVSRGVTEFVWWAGKTACPSEGQTSWERSCSF